MELDKQIYEIYGTTLISVTVTQGIWAYHADSSQNIACLVNQNTAQGRTPGAPAKILEIFRSQEEANKNMQPLKKAGREVSVIQCTYGELLGELAAGSLILRERGVILERFLRRRWKFALITRYVGSWTPRIKRKWNSLDKQLRAFCGGKNWEAYAYDIVPDKFLAEFNRMSDFAFVDCYGCLPPKFYPEEFRGD